MQYSNYQFNKTYNSNACKQKQRLMFVSLKYARVAI